MIQYIIVRSVFMEKKPIPSISTEAVTNVFKNGRMPTKEEYTNLWIKIINQMEREKANQQ